jgi:hypothetical protein
VSNPADVDGRFLCHECTRRYHRPGDCPHCPEEPLLDLADEEVRLFLDDFDSKARWRRFGLCFGAALPIGIPLVIVGGYYFSIHGQAGGAFATFGLATLFAKLFPAKRRSPRLGQNEIARLEETARQG